MAQDVGLARDPRLRAHRAALELRPGAPGDPGGRPRGGAARARGGDQQVVEGRAPRCLHRLQPERQGPDGRVGMVGAADAGRTRVHAARVGGGRRLRSGRVHPGHRARAAGRARRRLGGDRRGAGVARPAPRALRRAGSGGPRRRAVAAALQEAARRAAARHAVTAQARRRRGRRSTRRTRSPASSAGSYGIPRPRRCSRSTTSSWTRCGPGRPRGRGSGSI